MTDMTTHANGETPFWKTVPAGVENAIFLGQQVERVRNVDYRYDLYFGKESRGRNVVAYRWSDQQFASNWYYANSDNIPVGMLTKAAVLARAAGLMPPTDAEIIAQQKLDIAELAALLSDVSFHWHMNFQNFDLSKRVGEALERFGKQ